MVSLFNILQLIKPNEVFEGMKIVIYSSMVKRKLFFLFKSVQSSAIIEKYLRSWMTFLVTLMVAIILKISFWIPLCVYL